MWAFLDDNATLQRIRVTVCQRVSAQGDVPRGVVQVPRVLYVNALDPDLQGVQGAPRVHRMLPHNRPSHFLYKV